MSPLALQGDGVDAVSLGELAPALAELPAVDDDHRVAAPEEVDERRLHRAGAARGEDEHVLLRLEDVLEPLAYTRENTLEFRRPMVDDRLRHPQRKPLGNRRRAWGEKADLFHGLLLAMCRRWIGVLARRVKNGSLAGRLLRLVATRHATWANPGRGG